MNQRISAGGIVFRKNKVLLVRHFRPGNYDFLVMPGGGVNLNEDARAAAKREVWEEAGLNVDPRNLAYVEDLQSGESRNCKLWFYCEGSGGTPPSTKSDPATREYIADARFYSRDEIEDKIVFPQILFEDEFWENAKHGFPGIAYLGLRDQMY